MTILVWNKIERRVAPARMAQGRIALRNITQDVRDYAAKQGLTEDEALRKGVEETDLPGANLNSGTLARRAEAMDGRSNAVEFVKTGAEIYKEV